MKYLLIGINSKYIHPALSLYQLKANTSYDCVVKEFTIKDQLDHILDYCIKELKTSEYIGIAGTVYLWNVEFYLPLFKTLKDLFPKLKTILGGPEVGYDAEYFLTNNSYIDYILSGEGEESFHELCLYLDHKISLNQVSNLYYVNDGIVHYTYFKYPDLNQVKLAVLDVPDCENRIIYLESSRGCPYTCSYCTASLDNKVRFFPLEYILDILIKVMNKRCKTVKFLDRTFNANMKYMMQILDFIDEHNICTTFQFEVVGEKLSSEIINKIAHLKHKYLRFEIGIQSTNELVNLSVSRKQDIVKLRENILLLNQTNKVDLHLDLIAGLPYETKQSFISSFDEAFLMRGKELQLGFLKFLRGTKMLEMVNEHEYLYTNTPPYEIISNKYLRKDDLQEIHQVEKALNRYYNNNLCPRLFKYLLDNKLVKSYYLFFKNLYRDLSNYQKDELFKILDDYLKLLFPNSYDYLHFLLLIDYLENFKVKPKIWWDFNKITNREELFTYMLTLDSSLNKELLYRYSVIINYKTFVFVIIYKDFKTKSYLFEYLSD